MSSELDVDVQETELASSTGCILPELDDFRGRFGENVTSSSSFSAGIDDADEEEEEDEGDWITPSGEVLTTAGKSSKREHRQQSVRQKNFLSKKSWNIDLLKYIVGSVLPGPRS